MFEMMNQQALSVAAGRRREVAVETMREARLSNGAARRAAPLRVAEHGVSDPAGRLRALIQR